MGSRRAAPPALSAGAFPGQRRRIAARAAASRDALRTLGYEVQWHEYPMEHSVCLPEIEDLQQFLLQVLSPQ